MLALVAEEMEEACSRFGRKEASVGVCWAKVCVLYRVGRAPNQRSFQWPSAASKLLLLNASEKHLSIHLSIVIVGLGR